MSQIEYLFREDVKKAHREVESTLARMSEKDEIPGFTIPPEPMIGLRPVAQSWINVGTWKRHEWPSSIAYTCIPGQCYVEADITTHPDEDLKLIEEVKKIEECGVVGVHEHEAEKHVHIICTSAQDRLASKIKQLLETASKY